MSDFITGPEPAAPRRRERWLAAGILCALVLWRTSVFLVWPQAYFDADQAVFGLMAKHLSELRAFPLFMYGQSYILAVEAWMAAPLFALFGSSAFLLKLPLVAVNLAVVLLLLRLLEREAGLRPLLAAAAALPFALPAPGTAAFFLEPSGGNLEPFLYVLLLWMARARPNIAGIILGIGFLHREFTIYGLVALVAIELAHGTLFTRDGIVRRLQMFRTAAEVWIVVQFTKPFASAAGPGTSIADVVSAPNNLVELANRTCIDPQTVAIGLGRMTTSHWPQLFGMLPAPLGTFSIESLAWQGLPGVWWLWPLLILIGVVGAVWGVATAGNRRAALSVCVYMLLVGLLSAGGYAAGRCGEVVRNTMRYELLSIMGIVGLGALCLASAPHRWLRHAWLALSVACTLVAAIGHARFTYEYVTNRPIGQKEQLVRAVETRGLQYAYADYWLAYYVSFATNERVIVASTDFVRVKSYEPIVAANRSQAMQIAREGCPAGRHLTQFFFLCPLGP